MHQKAEIQRDCEHWENVSTHKDILTKLSVCQQDNVFLLGNGTR